ncbi:MAG: hypothetical protein WB526_10505, partial [Candidatus Cybelea sp.]
MRFSTAHGRAVLKCPPTATRQGVVDPDILTCYPEQVKNVKLGADGKPDVGTIVNAIRAIKQKAPALFKETQWDRMDEATYSEA